MDKTITPDRILTIGFREYAESQGRPLSSYLPVGVQGNFTELGSEAPENTEVIVNVIRTNCGSLCAGTALVRNYEEDSLTDLSRRL